MKTAQLCRKTADYPHRSSIKRILGLFACVLSVSSCLYLSLSRNNDLKNKARTLVRVPQTLSLRWGYSFQYRWVSDHELVIVQGENHNHNLHISLKDTQTGKVIVLSRLSQLLTRCSGGISWMEISPDGKALLVGFSFMDSQEFIFARLDESSHSAWEPPVGRLGTVQWAKDGRHLAALVRRGSPKRFLLEWQINNSLQSSEWRLRDLPDPSDRLWLLHCGEKNYLLARPETNAENEITSVELTEVNRHSEVPFQSRRLRMPDGQAIKEIVVSPDGQRIAYLCEEPYKPVLPLFLQRWFGRYRVPNQKSSLWVSSVKGDKREEIGYTLHTTTPTDTSDSISKIQWLPGKKSLSFYYKESIQVVDF